MNPNRLSVDQVATRTGLSARSIYNLINDRSLVARGTPLRIDEHDVDQLITARQTITAARIGNLERFAKEVRDRLQWPGGRRGTDLPLDQDARAIWGPHVVQAAGMREGSGCKWCWARMSASVHGGLLPDLTDAHRILLGAPCAKDLQHFQEKLRRRHARMTNPAAETAGSQQPSQATRHTQRRQCGHPTTEPCRCNTVTAAAWTPPTDDTQLVARRRTELTTRLRAAQQAGDTAYSGQLRRMLTALAASGAQPKPNTSRTDIHGCGCACAQHRSQP